MLLKFLQILVWEVTKLEPLLTTRALALLLHGHVTVVTYDASTMASTIQKCTIYAVRNVMSPRSRTWHLYAVESTIQKGTLQFVVHLSTQTLRQRGKWLTDLDLFLGYFWRRQPQRRALKHNHNAETFFAKQTLRLKFNCIVTRHSANSFTNAPAQSMLRSMPWRSLRQKTNIAPSSRGSTHQPSSLYPHWMSKSDSFAEDLRMCRSSSTTALEVCVEYTAHIRELSMPAKVRSYHFDWRIWDLCAVLFDIGQ